MKSPSANRCSALPAFWLCASSWAPIESEPPERDMSAADLGSEVHALIAENVQGGEHPIEPSTEAEPLVEVAMEALESIPALEEKHRGMGKREGVEVNLEWLHPRLSGHVDDLWSEVVIDHKSGWRDTDYEPQVKGYVWLVWVREGRPSKFKMSAYLVWLRFQKMDRFEYTADDMKVFEAEYMTKLTQIGKVYNPGEACLYCDRKHECPQHKEWLAESHALVMADGHALTTREQLAAAYPRLQELGKAVEACKARVRAAAEEKPLDLGGGYELRITGGSRTEIDAGIGWPVLEDWVSLEVLPSCVTVGKKKTIDAVRAATPKGTTKKAREKEFMDALKEIGALVKTQTAGQMRRMKREAVDE